MKVNYLLFKALIFLGSTLGILTGCSQKFNVVQDTFSLALFGHDDVIVQPEYVNNLPYASLYAKSEEGSQAFMVLGYAHPSASNLTKRNNAFQLKWLSATNEMLVTEYGRIVKTINLRENNLTASYSHLEDPLSLGLLNSSTPQIWKRKVDWQPGNHIGVVLESRFELQGQHTLLINDKLVSTFHFIEYVDVPQLNRSFKNEFWLNADSGRVVSSIQTPAPNMESIELTILKPFSSTSQ